ncbi:acetylcholinesterase-like [Ornithodoros turicata]|uniref:acetylcholinesterase-like n=1 Tax=Ornithodoros turicata TaxID=34597 RepID=UPI003139B1A9
MSRGAKIGANNGDRWLHLLLLVTLCAVCKADVVSTSTGPVRGFQQRVMNRTIYSFLGIPYAEPPVGRLRFRRPIVVRPWSQVKECMELPPRCMQGRLVSSEDCLYLNIWTPSLDPRSELNVMVYFHGGIFLYERPLIQRDLRYMAAMGNAVLVKMNYRLGAFGFLNLNDEEVRGNMGIYDQYLALRWVKENIHLFGGDAKSITAFGNSAGAMSIGLLVTSPLGAPLIHRAVMQSGSPCVSVISLDNNSISTANIFAREAGCADDDMTVETRPKQILACLRRVGPQKLLMIQHDLLQKLQVFFPVFGDEMLPLNVLEALKQGRFRRDLSVMLGVTRDEGTTILNTVSPQFFRRDSHRRVTKSQLFSTCNQTFLHSFSKSSLRKIYWSYLGLLGHTDYRTLRTAIANCIADYFMVCPAHQFAEGVQKHGGQVYFYKFDYRTKNAVQPPWMGVIHTAELFYLFGEPFSSSWYTDREKEFSRTIVNIWTTFAKTGRPPEEFHWPPYEWNRPRYLKLSPNNFRPAHGPREEWCKLWKQHLN